MALECGVQKRRSQKRSEGSVLISATGISHRGKRRTLERCDKTIVAICRQ